MHKLVYAFLFVFTLFTVSAYGQAVPNIPDGEIGDPRTAPKPRPGHIPGTVPHRTVPYPIPGKHKGKPTKVPFDAKKVGRWIGQNAKKGHAQLIGTAIIEGLGYAVDYVLDPANNRATYPDYQCKTNGYGNFTANSYDEFVAGMRAIENRFFTYPGDYINKNGAIYRKDSRGTQIFVGTCRERQVDIPLDELADKILDAAERGKPNAPRVLDQWAEDEIRTNPGPYRRQHEEPDSSPNPDGSPRPNPNEQPNPHPSPNPNPGFEPSPVPSPNPEPYPNPVPVPNPNELPQPNPRPEPGAEPNPNPNPNPNELPNPNPGDEPYPMPQPSPNGSPSVKVEVKPFELPAFCSWATVVCEFIDWFKQSPDKPKDIDDVLQADDGKIPDNTDKRYYDARGQCPANQPLVLAIGTIELSYQPLCDFLSRLAPFVMAAAYITGAYIVLGASRG